METIPFIQMALYELHRSLIREVETLTPEQMAYRPAPGASTINFLTWHIPRIADNVFHRVAHTDGTLPLWERENWYEQFGLTSGDTGTGFSVDQVEALKPARDTLIAYCQHVFETIMSGLDGLTNEDLDRVLNPEQPRNTVARSVQSIIIGHGYYHLGEVRFLKGLQGMPFAR